MSFAIGVGAAIFGNAIIGVGQCLQKYAINKLQVSQNSTGKRSSRSMPQKTSGSRLTSPLWLAGMALAYTGEFGNMLGITFASAAIVSPLGIISVFSNALLASRLLGERISGRKQRQGYIYIVLGVLLILLVAPKGGSSAALNADLSLPVLIDNVQDLSQWSAFVLSSWIFWSVAALFSVGFAGFVKVHMHTSNDESFALQSKESDGNINIYLFAGACFGAVSIMCAKAASQYFRVLSTQSISAAKSKTETLQLDQNYYSLLLPLLASVVCAVIGQEVMKQMALSKFPVSKFQPQYYAAYNIVVVLTSSIVYQEISGSTKWLMFLVNFAVGIVSIVHGSSMIQSDSLDDNIIISGKRQV